MDDAADRVTLREITRDTVRDVIGLAVRPEQQGFVAPNAVSLAQALFSAEAWYRAIHAGDELVGFVMLSDETLLQPPPAQPRVTLWRFMIDARFQRRGFGRAAMARVIEHVAGRPGVSRFHTSFVPAEGGPAAFYLGLGFEPTGELDEGEVVAVLSLDRARAPA